MHELSLYGAVSAERRGRLLQQLAGVTCMQPQTTREMHLVFKARTPAGLDKVQVPGSGGSAGTTQQQQELQKLRTMLQSGLFYVQLVGSIQASTNKQHDQNGHKAEDVAAVDQKQKMMWSFEFKDTPEAAKQPVNTRLISRVKFEGGDAFGFLDLLGYEYIHRYVVEGEKFYNQDTTLFIHRIRQLPKAQNAVAASTLPESSSWDQLPLLDTSEAYVLQAIVEITDGNNQDLRDRAIRQLIAMRDTLRGEVVLAQADRLALDTRFIPPRRL